ncbi:MAG: RNA 2',3'-cyclic phosphodiesterase [Candidatus Bathyarchaeota archaeon]|nr:RNA 2',3'-cyclic phosphodiesterase [Candidatus Bathyarchaeota archaeon]
MSESIRSFIAFDMENDAVLNRIAAVQNLLAQTGADLKPVEPRNIHVTIRFLGNITPATAEKIFEEMKKVQFTPFTAKISGIGAFPDVRYPRVVWAGITEGADQLRSIFTQLEPRLRGLGFAPDPKGFSPHLTIARVRSGRNKQQLAEFINKNAKYDFSTINARCLRLKKSVLTPKGPIYSTLKEFCPQP